MAKEKNSYPMLSINHWHILRAQFKKSIPTSLTKTYLAPILNLSEASARSNVYTPLRQLGFMDSDNKTDSDLVVRFRDDNQYSKFCKELIKEIYPQELIDAFPDSTSDINKITSWFMNTGVGEPAARRMAAFYYELLIGNPNREQVAGKKEQNGTKPSKRKIAKKAPLNIIIPVKAKEQPTEQSPESTNHLKTIHTNLGNGVTVNINIQLTVPETSDEKIYESFFRAMKKHLLS